MILYVRNQNNKIVELDIKVPTRLELCRRLNSEHIYVGNEEYHVNEVWAKPSSNSTITGGIAGGLIGALAGPIGILAAAAIGAAIGGSAQEDENRSVNVFNESVV